MQSLQQQPTIQAQAQATGGRNEQSLNVTDALSYLNAVKSRFSNHIDVYNRFLDILKDFRSEVIDTPGVIERVCDLFGSHPDLIDGFNIFLPIGYHIETSPDDSVLVRTPNGISHIYLRPDIDNQSSSNQLVINLEGLMVQNPAIDLTGRVTIPNSFKVVHGGYATVYTGVLDGKPVAVKVLKASKNVSNPAEWERKLQRSLVREINVWAALSHPNIAEFLGYTDGFGDFAAMVSSWCEFGTANVYLSKGFIAQRERIRLSREVATGLQYLHDLKIIHGDLKPTNILIGDDRTARLTDFGLVRLEDWQGPSGMTTTTPYTGTVRYKAPELFASSDNRFPVATFEGDIHALGCICFEFVTYRQPYSAYNNVLDLRRAIEERDPPATRPRDLHSEFDVLFWNLLQECWSWYPENRPPVAAVVEVLKGLS